MRFRQHFIGAAVAAMATTAAMGAWAQNTVVPGDPAATVPGETAPGGRADRPYGGHGHRAQGDHGPGSGHGHGAQADHRHDAQGDHRHGDRRGHGGDPARFERRMEQRISRMVTQVGGTAEQRDRIVAIMKTAVADQAKLREEGRGLRGQQMALLKAPTIDRAALEQQRARRLSLFDAMSRRMTTAMADAAEVLTPEQRVKFAELAERRGFGAGQGPHGRGGPGFRHGHGMPPGGPEGAPPTLPGGPRG
jgi:Spy/CpxP family protein refolding chaperone